MDIGDLSLSYYEYGSASFPTILMVHGLGLHARCWDAVIRAMTHECRIVAVDLRGHGRSQTIPPYEWPTFGEDLTKFIEELKLSELIGVGHSLGGHALLKAATTAPNRIQSMLLVDPAVSDPEITETRNFLSGYTDMEAHPTERKTNEWESVTSMIKYFNQRDPYRCWNLEVLEDYCRYGVVRESNNVFKLAFPLVVEAIFYLGPVEHISKNLLASISSPITLMRAKHMPGPKKFFDFSHSVTRPDMIDLISTGIDIYLPELTHFIPMQRPDLVAEQIDKLLLSAAS